MLPFAGMYPGWKTGLPATLGADVCGTVEQVASDVDAAMVGSVVVVDPSMDWGDDDRFQVLSLKVLGIKKPSDIILIQGAAHTILGMPRNGTFAEYVSVPAGNVHQCPSHLQSEPIKAAALPLAGVTAWRALMTKGGCRAGDKVTN